MVFFFFSGVNFWQDPHWNMLLWHCADYNSYQGCALPWKQELVNKNPTQKDYLNHDEENPLPVYPLKKLMNGVKSLLKQNILNLIRMKMNGLMFGRINLIWHLGTWNWHVLFCECFMSSPKKWYIYDTIFKIRLTHIMLFVCHETTIHMKWNVEAGSTFHCFYKDCI